jgi:hypothetical protein
MWTCMSACMSVYGCYIYHMNVERITLIILVPQLNLLIQHYKTKNLEKIMIPYRIILIHLYHWRFIITDYDFYILYPKEIAPISAIIDSNVRATAHQTLLNEDGSACLYSCNRRQQRLPFTAIPTLLHLRILRVITFIQNPRTELKTDGVGKK